jgi:hypothetical protein
VGGVPPCPLIDAHSHLGSVPGYNALYKALFGLFMHSIHVLHSQIIHVLYSQINSYQYSIAVALGRQGGKWLKGSSLYTSIMGMSLSGEAARGYNWDWQVNTYQESTPVAIGRRDGQWLKGVHCIQAQWECHLQTKQPEAITMSSLYTSLVECRRHGYCCS